MAIEFITNAITSVFKNKAAKDAIINAAITKVAGGSDKEVLLSGLGTYASQEYGIPGTPKTPPPFTEGVPQMTIEDLLADILEYRKGAEFDISMGDPGGAEEKYAKIREAEEKIDQLKNPAKTGGTPEFIKNIGDYFGFGGLEDLKEKYGEGSVFDKFPGGAGGLAAMGILGKVVYDDYKKREKGIAATPQVMMDSLGRYQLASDMGTGGTRGEFGLGPKPSVLKVAGGGEINRQYFSEGGIAELDMRDGGESEGPGTGTSDDIPAMLSDGEYVMTAKATRGAGAFDLSKSDSGITLVKTDNPDRERGVANMRELMNIFEEM
jgi:hypothetical protein